MESWLRHPLNKNATTVIPARAPVPEWQEAKSASSARGAGGQFVREHMLAHVVLAVCAISVCRALLHPIYNASKPANSARTARSQPARGHILPHSLPAARALSPHYPIFNIPSKGVWGRCRTRLIRMQQLLFLHALLHPIYNASKPASPTHAAENQPIRKQMLPHSLPAARALFPHYPIFIIPSKGYGGLPPCLPIGP